MGIHTGDSVTVAPALTLTDKEYQVMRNASIACLRKIGVETGGSNVQFAINPKNGRMVVIEMNPRVSRSSALASKATGFPIAKVAAKLAVGYTLDELKNEITKVTPASFEPTIDYVVTKIPRFTFEKFSSSPAILGTSMKSVGEAMAIGRNFKESLQKALVSLETGFSGLDQIFDLIQNAYSSIGGHVKFKSSSDVLDPELTYWKVADVDDDPEIDVTTFGKNTSKGIKHTGLGHDGERANIKNLLRHKTSLLKSPGNYVEVSGAAFDSFVGKGGAPTIVSFH